MTYQEIKSFINTYIVQNGVGAITGSRLNTALNALADYYGFDSVVVTTLPAGSDATVNVQGRTLELGIPKGADGTDGRDGLDAVNPFKGWFNSLADLKASYTASVGDSAYVKDASPATTWSIYVYDSTASSDNYWADSGMDADTSNVQTFQTGEEVNQTPIDNTHLDNPASGALAKAEDAKKVKDNVDYTIEGIGLHETLATSTQVSNMFINGTTGTPTSSSVNSVEVIQIPSGTKKVRFLGIDMRNSSTLEIGFALGWTLDGNPINSNLSNFYPKYHEVFSKTGGDDSVKKEYIVDIEPPYTYLCVTNSPSIVGAAFYCYLQDGETVCDIVDGLKSRVSQTTSYINGLLISGTGIITTYESGRLYYTQVSAGDKLKVRATSSTASNYRIGITSVLPVENVSVSQLYSQPNNQVDIDIEFVCESNGYFCMGTLATAFTNIKIYKEEASPSVLTKKELCVVLFGGNFSSLGGLRDRINEDTEFMTNYVSNMYDVTNKKLVGITGVEAGDTLSILQYDEQFSLLGDCSVLVDMNPLTSYVAFKISTAAACNYTNKKITLTYNGADNIEKVSFGAYTLTPRYVTFEVSRMCNVNPADEQYSGGERLYTQGFIITPPNYSRIGKKVPIAIFVHGTGGYTWGESSIVSYGDLLNFVAKNGFAVIDCCTMTNKYSASKDLNNQTRTGYRDTNYPCRLSVDCYVSLYKFVCENFNVDPDRVYLWGKSSGGRLATVLAQSRLLPIKAVGVINGSTDSLTDFRVLGEQSLIAVKKLMEDDLGFENIPNDFVSNTMRKAANSVSNNLRDYLLANKDKIAGYNPLFTGISNFDIDAYETAQFACSLEAADISTSMLDNSTLMGVVDGGFKTSLVPTKIWAAVDDENVPYPMAVIYTKLVKAGGGICELRTIPAGFGKHWAVDIAPNVPAGYDAGGSAPKVDYTTKFGEVVNVTVTYAEIVDWFNRW